MTVRLRVWGKVNLILRVEGVRPDGYHLLYSYAASVDVGDEVRIAPDPSGTVTVSAPELEGAVAERDNLAWKAAMALQRLKPGAALGARIEVRKAIPAGAGMGGASADAAAVLHGLNRLWGLGLDDGELARVGVQLGADVPFCLRGGLALMEGIGERLTPLPFPGPLALVRVSLPVALSTKRVFECYDALMAEGSGRRGSAPQERLAPEAFLKAWRRGPECLGPLLQNDLEAAAVRLAPGVAEAKAALLRAGAAGAVMTGSGPTVIGLARDPEDAARLAAAMRQAGWNAQPMGLRPQGVEALEPGS